MMPAAPLGARVVEEEVGRHPRFLLLGREWERERREERAPLSGCAEAAERGAARDAARVKADEIEARAHLRREEELAGADGEVDARSARAAGVEEERADPVRLVRGRQPDDGERDRPDGLVVVERHLHRRAFERPLRLEAFVPLEVGLDRRRGGSLTRPHSDRHEHQHAQSHEGSDPLTRHARSLQTRSAVPRPSRAICSQRRAACQAAGRRVNPARQPGRRLDAAVSQDVRVDPVRWTRPSCGPRQNDDVHPAPTRSAGPSSCASRAPASTRAGDGRTRSRTAMD